MFSEFDKGHYSVSLSGQSILDDQHQFVHNSFIINSYLILISILFYFTALIISCYSLTSQNLKFFLTFCLC